MLAAAGDDKACGWDAAPPQRSSGRCPDTFAFVHNLQRHVLGYEFIERRSEHDAVERPGFGEERARLIGRLEVRGVAIDVKSERSAPSVHTIHAHAVSWTRAVCDGAREIGNDLP